MSELAKPRLFSIVALVGIVLGVAVGLLISLGVHIDRVAAPGADTPGISSSAQIVSPTAAPTARPAATPTAVSPVTIGPGDPAQAIVDDSPPGSVFVLGAGVHYETSLIPRDGDTFIGEKGAVLSGARLLSSFEQEDDLWFAPDQTQEGFIAGRCEDGTDACRYPEDLFVDNVLLKRVLSKAEVVPGSWYFDYATDRAYLADDPSGRRVEIGVLPYAFYGAAKDVTIQNLVIEKYASPAQRGAIHMRDETLGSTGSDWLIDSNEVRWNHSAGIYIGTRSRVVSNYVHHNGQLGLKGGGEDTIVEGNTITYNNTSGFKVGWETGGAKFTHTTNLIVRDNEVGFNFGPGLWTDIDNIHTTYEGNRIFNNNRNGILHEISYDAVIRGNTLWDNGLGFDVWMWGGQITISTSQNVEIYENTVFVSPEGGDGITLVQQERASSGGVGAYGPLITVNNHVHHNSIYYLGSEGQTGAAADFNPATMFSGGNLFDHNTYYVLDPNMKRWEWQGEVDWTEFRAAGQEAQGEYVVIAEGSIETP